MLLAAEGIVQTPDCLRAAEDDLLDATGGFSVLWCGRGATALFLAYRVAARRRNPGGEEGCVALPALSCATPANTARMAGLLPRFVDVEEETGLMRTGDLVATEAGGIVAATFVDLYGQTADLGRLLEWCRKHDILLIEDVAQAQGAKLPDGRSVGSMGDFSIYSFNRTKILECGGGALVVRTRDLEDQLRWEMDATEDGYGRAVVALTRLQEKLLGESYRNVHHGLVALLRGRSGVRVCDQFMGLRPYYEPLYVRPMLDPGKVAAAWGSLCGVVSRRRAKAEQYSRILGGNGPWELVEGWRSSGVCWRYSLLLDDEDALVPLSERLRGASFHVSNLYWPVQHFFRPEDRCPGADRFAKRIMNLWVDDSVDEDWVQKCAKTLVGFARDGETLV